MQIFLFPSDNNNNNNIKKKSILHKVVVISFPCQESCFIFPINKNNTTYKSSITELKIIKLIAKNIHN